MGKRGANCDPIGVRLWRLVDKNGPVHPVLGTRCWLWLGALEGDGYGRIRHRTPHDRVHRVVWEIERGPIPDGHGVLHHCDRKICVNYESHLFTGTNATNTADKVAKNRQARGGFTGPINPAIGERNAAAKLTEQQVREIRERHGRGFRHGESASKYGVSISIISRIVRGASWRHVKK